MAKGRKELTRVEWIADAIATMKKQIEETKQQKHEHNEKAKNHKRD